MAVFQPDGPMSLQYHENWINLDLMGLAGWRCVTHPQPAPMYVTAVLVLEQIASNTLEVLARNQMFPPQNAKHVACSSGQRGAIASGEKFIASSCLFDVLRCFDCP